VAQSVARYASDAGFRTIVVDDREKFANRERFPTAAEIAVENIPDWLDRAAVRDTAYAVILTRGHRHDLDALRALIGRDLRYLGLIGSRAKVARLVEALIEEGVPVERLERLHSPIGLDIGAVTPQEIAIAIVAELIGVKRRADVGEGFGRPLRWTSPALRQRVSD
jgi:xanthine dehydrogenase accessory factor